MKNVLLTGATRGLGLAIANRLAADGYRVLTTGRRLTPELDSLMKREGGHNVLFEPFDFENIEGIHNFVTGLTNDHGPLYGLVNNAGIGLDGVLATMHNSEIDTVLRVNLHAPIVLTKYACRSMLVNGEGRVINISSIIARTGFNGLSAYGASKAGLEGFTRSLSREIGRAHITANCVAPGFLETEMTDALQGSQLDSIRRRSPLGLAEVEDVAASVAFLLSDDAGKISGTVITVDGGSTA